MDETGFATYGMLLALLAADGDIDAAWSIDATHEAAACGYARELATVQGIRAMQRELLRDARVASMAGAFYAMDLLIAPRLHARAH